MIRKLLILFLFLIPFVAAQTPISQPITNQPTCDQTIILTKLQQEEQNTRKFIIDTADQKTQAFFESADQRINAIEEEMRSQLRNAAIRLSIMWFSVTLLVFALFGFISLLFYRRRHNKIRKDIKEDVIKELKMEMRKAVHVTTTSEKPIVELKPPIKVETPKPPQPDITIQQLQSFLDNYNQKGVR